MQKKKVKTRRKNARSRSRRRRSRRRRSRRRRQSHTSGKPYKDDAFKLGRLLGKGGMGEVYLATYVRSGTGKRIASAVKKVPFSVMDLKETELQAKLSKHPQCNKHVACLYELYKDPETENYYIVMEYIKGEDLWDYIGNMNRAASAQKLRGLFRQALEGLTFIHSKGMAHGDVKSDNMMIDRSSSPFELKFIDLGFGCTVGTCRSSSALHGTRVYEPPESFFKEHSAAKTLRNIKRGDVWGLGQVFAELLVAGSGKHPKDVQGLGITGKQLKEAKVNSATWRASDVLRQETPKKTPEFDNLYKVIDGMMRIDPSKRLTAAQALKILNARD